jgi:hypothetical protein
MYILPSFLFFLSFLCLSKTKIFFTFVFQKQRFSLSLFVFQSNVKDKVTPRGVQLTLMSAHMSVSKWFSLMSVSEVPLTLT